MRPTSPALFAMHILGIKSEAHLSCERIENDKASCFEQLYRRLAWDKRECDICRCASVNIHRKCYDHQHLSCCAVFWFLSLHHTYKSSYLFFLTFFLCSPVSHLRLVSCLLCSSLLSQHWQAEAVKVQRSISSFRLSLRLSVVMRQAPGNWSVSVIACEIRQSNICFIALYNVCGKKRK